MALDVDKTNVEAIKVLSVKLCRAQRNLKKYSEAEVCAGVAWLCDHRLPQRFCNHVLLCVGPCRNHASGPWTWTPICSTRTLSKQKLCSRSRNLINRSAFSRKRGRLTSKITPRERASSVRRLRRSKQAQRTTTRFWVWPEMQQHGKSKRCVPISGVVRGFCSRVSCVSFLFLFCFFFFYFFYFGTASIVSVPGLQEESCYHAPRQVPTVRRPDHRRHDGRVQESVQRLARHIRGTRRCLAIFFLLRVEDWQFDHVTCWRPDSSRPVKCLVTTSSKQNTTAEKRSLRTKADSNSVAVSTHSAAVVSPEAGSVSTSASERALAPRARASEQASVIRRVRIGTPKQ